MSGLHEPGASVFRMGGRGIASRNLAVVLAVITVVVIVVAVRAAVAAMAAVPEHHYRIRGRQQFLEGLLRCRLYRGRSAAHRGDLFLEFADPLQFGQLNSRGLPAF